jgi:DNA-binding NarL/FixJ family response regulator
MKLTFFKIGGRDVYFTRQQFKILKLASEGLSNKEISELLCIEVSTVKRHRQDIMGKLEIKGKTAMMKFLLVFNATFNP